MTYAMQTYNMFPSDCADLTVSKIVAHYNARLAAQYANMPMPVNRNDFSTIHHSHRALVKALTHAEAWFANSNRDKASELYLRKTILSALKAAGVK